MLDIFTIVWGWCAQLYIEGTLPGLLQEGNIPSCKDLIAAYYFYATDEARGVITQSPLYSQLEKKVKICWEPHRVDRQGNHPGFDINSDLLSQMDKSAKTGNYMFMMPADIVLGNKSLMNLANLCAQGRYQVIMYTFPKVPNETYDLIKQVLNRGNTLSNRQLVSIAMTVVPESPPDARLLDGPTIIKVAENRWSIHFHSPAPVIVANQDLINWFSQNPYPHHGYDHFVQYWYVVNNYSWHLIPHSDIYFQLEHAHPWRGGSGPWNLDWLSKATIFFSQFETIWQGE